MSASDNPLIPQPDSTDIDLDLVSGDNDKNTTSDIKGVTKIDLIIDTNNSEDAIKPSQALVDDILNIEDKSFRVLRDREDKVIEIGDLENQIKSVNTVSRADAQLVNESLKDVSSKELNINEFTTRGSDLGREVILSHIESLKSELLSDINKDYKKILDKIYTDVETIYKVDSQECAQKLAELRDQFISNTYAYGDHAMQNGSILVALKRGDYANMYTTPLKRIDLREVLCDENKESLTIAQGMVDGVNKHLDEAGVRLVIARLLLEDESPNNKDEILIHERAANLSIKDLCNYIYNHCQSYQIDDVFSNIKESIELAHEQLIKLRELDDNNCTLEQSQKCRDQISEVASVAVKQYLTLKASIHICDFAIYILDFFKDYED